MKILRITTKEKPVLHHLQDAWEAPDDQDILTSDIIKWLKKNLHRSDVGLWVAIHEAHIVGCLMAIGPSLLDKSVQIYAAWVKKGAPVKTQDFFEGPLIDWVRSLGCNEISMSSSRHTGRSLERKFGFKGYTRVYHRSLEPIELGLESGEVAINTEETEDA